MIATGEDVLLVCTGGPKPNKFKYWHSYDYSETTEAFLKTLNRYGGFGKAYYYSEHKIWFRKEKYLTMYLLVR